MEERLTRRPVPCLATGGQELPRPDPCTREVIGDQVLGVDLYVEERVRTVPAEEAVKRKYEWQHATPVETWQFNGRLSLHGHA